jgi:transcription antitermination factor NusG
MAERWYVVNTKYNHEFIAVQELKNQEFKAFCPRYQQKIKKRDTISIIERPLYAGYAFVAFDVDMDPWFKVKYTRGVVQILSSSSDRAIPLPLGWVEHLMDASKLTGKLVIEERTIDPRITVGCQVIVNAINFRGFRGTVMALRKDKIIINTSLLSRKVELILPLNLVRFSEPLDLSGAAVASATC